MNKNFPFERTHAFFPTDEIISTDFPISEVVLNRLSAINNVGGFFLRICTTDRVYFLAALFIDLCTTKVRNKKIKSC